MNPSMPLITTLVSLKSICFVTQRTELFVFSASAFRTFDRYSVPPGHVVPPRPVLPDEALLTILNREDS